MIKFNRATSKDLYSRKKKLRNQSVELEPPKEISLESLQLIANDLNSKNLVLQSQISLGPPPAISIEDLRAIVNESLAAVPVEDLGPPPTISLESLFTIVRTNQANPSFKIWRCESLVEEKELEALDTVILDPSQFEKPIETPELKPSFDQAAVIKNLEVLTEGENLESWIGSLNLPKKLDTSKIKEELRTFLRTKPWEKPGSIPFEGTTEASSLAKKLISKFKDLSILKQIVVVLGITVLIAAGVFVTVQLLSLLWPSILGVGGLGNSALVEIGVEAFKQRQEPAFHLLNAHAEQAKPMSYAWANQYVLWKYVL